MELAPQAVDMKETVQVPLMKLRDLTASNRSSFMDMMQKHGYVVLTNVGPVQRRYLEIEKKIRSFFSCCPSSIKEATKGEVYFNERGIPMWHSGYESCGQVREAFRVGVAGAMKTSLSYKLEQLRHRGSSPGPKWPCQHLKSAWLALLHLLRKVCHRALTVALGRPVTDPLFFRAAKPLPVLTSMAAEGTWATGGGILEGLSGVQCWDVERNEDKGEEEADTFVGANKVGTVCRRRAADGTELLSTGELKMGKSNSCCRSPVMDAWVCADGADDSQGDSKEQSVLGEQQEEEEQEEDFSVSYALHYPNDHCDPALVKEGLTVGEHVDPSLFVAEPCCGVAGLEIKDQASGRWIEVEALCAGLGVDQNVSISRGEGRDTPSPKAGGELILFGGKALERATGGKVRGAVHRVRRGDQQRFCFIYEQKYGEFFPPPTMD
ncbi:unnamed protein product [Choristocarpus tenellus]